MRRFVVAMIHISEWSPAVGLRLNYLMSKKNKRILTIPSLLLTIWGPLLLFVLQCVVIHFTISPSTITAVSGIAHRRCCLRVQSLLIVDFSLVSLENGATGTLVFQIGSRRFAFDDHCSSMTLLNELWVDNAHAYSRYQSTHAFCQHASLFLIRFAAVPSFFERRIAWVLLLLWK